MISATADMDTIRLSFQFVVHRPLIYAYNPTLESFQLNV